MNCCTRFTLLAMLLVVQNTARADLSLETETARTQLQGHYQISMAAEFQYASDGKEAAIPFAFEYGITDRLEVLVEPVPYIGIFAGGEKKIHGLGDIEVTLTYLALPEQEQMPAIAFAAEVKLPTAQDLSIGTREFDYAFYVIASKQIGNLDLHANLSYTFIGEPTGTSAKDVWSVALAGDYTLNDKWDLFAEVMYTTSAQDGVLPGGDSGDAVSAEVGGVDIVGTLGARYKINKDISIFSSVSYNNQDDTLVRAGITWQF